MMYKLNRLRTRVSGSFVGILIISSWTILLSASSLADTPVDDATSLPHTASQESELLSKSEKSINIVSWWGYLQDKYTQPIEQKCGVDIYVDEYYSNPEFMRRLQKYKYNIAIYSDAMYNSLHHILQPDQAPLNSGIVEQYLPHVQTLYSESNYQQNTVFFLFSVTGFLWNKHNIKLSQQDSLETLFKKAKGKTVVLLDDSAEVINLLTNMNQSKDIVSNIHHSTPSLDQVKNLPQGSPVIIASSLGSILKMPNFSFAYTWSGFAINRISDSTQPEKYGFTAHPALSHWSKDLLTTFTSDDATLCVAKELASIEFTDKLAKDFYYFPPYKHSTPVENNIYTPFYDEFRQSFGKIPPRQAAFSRRARAIGS